MGTRASSLSTAKPGAKTKVVAKKAAAKKGAAKAVPTAKKAAPAAAPAPRGKVQIRSMLKTTAAKRAPAKGTGPESAAKSKSRGVARKVRSKAGAWLLSAPAPTALVEHLRAVARRERLSLEALVSDVTVVQADSGLPVESAEIQTLSALGTGGLPALRARLEGRVALEPGNPQMKVLSHLDSGVALMANASALRTVRRTSPGLRMFQAALLYPQRVQRLGDELAAHALDVAPGPGTKTFIVRLKDPAGQPVSGVKVTAMLDELGTLVTGVSDEAGQVSLSIPRAFPRIGFVAAEPEHTYWGKFLEGFDRTGTASVLDIQMQPLVPDAFRLMTHYASFDAAAGQGVKVGVIDSGVGPHEDLTVEGGGCFVTGENSNDFQDNGIGHGTHVAGIIAARRSAGGLYGLAPACTLFAYRVCPKTGRTGVALSVDVAAALQQAIVDRCDLVNISLGSVQAMPELPDVLQKARDAGMVIISATGNDARELLRYPARYSHTLSVGALGRDGTFPEDSPERDSIGPVRAGREFVATFSNHGQDTDFIGVGVAVLSTYPGNRYAMMSGTSMATPFTTGMAARLLSANPQVLQLPRNAERADRIVELLCQHVRRPSWPDKFGGFGVLT